MLIIFSYVHFPFYLDRDSAYRDGWIPFYTPYHDMCMHLTSSAPVLRNGLVWALISTPSSFHFSLCECILQEDEEHLAGRLGDVFPELAASLPAPLRGLG